MSLANNFFVNLVLPFSDEWKKLQYNHSAVKDKITAVLQFIFYIFFFYDLLMVVIVYGQYLCSAPPASGPCQQECSVYEPSLSGPHCSESFHKCWSTQMSTAPARCVCWLEKKKTCEKSPWRNSTAGRRPYPPQSYMRLSLAISTALKSSLWPMISLKYGMVVVMVGMLSFLLKDRGL